MAVSAKSEGEKGKGKHRPVSFVLFLMDVLGGVNLRRFVLSKLEQFENLRTKKGPYDPKKMKFSILGQIKARFGDI